jgi:hypothetical protein
VTRANRHALTQLGLCDDFVAFGPTWLAGDRGEVADAVDKLRIPRRSPTPVLTTIFTGPGTCIGLS